MQNGAIGERLSVFIKKTGLNRAKFARKTGIDASQLHRMVKGDQDPGSTSLQKISIVFSNLNLRWLLTGEEEMLTTKISEEERFVLDAYHGSPGKEDQKFKFLIQCQNLEKESNELKEISLNLDKKKLKLNSVSRQKLFFWIKDLQDKRNQLLSDIYIYKGKQNLLDDGTRLESMQEMLEENSRSLKQLISLSIPTIQKIKKWEEL